MTTVTIPITLTIDGVAVPSSMTLDPSLLPAGPKAATGPAGPVYIPPVLPMKVAAIPADHIVTLIWI